MRILAFDDEADTILLYKRILGKLGHEVIGYTSCTDLLEIISKVKPDAIFLDISMPGITGLEAGAIIKNNPAYSNIPIVYCSAQVDILEKSEIAKVVNFLVKPLTIPNLEKCINRLFSLFSLKPNKELPNGNTLHPGRL